MSSYTTAPLTPETWDAFARLVGRNNGVWGGCWCIGFHPDGFQGSPEANRDRKRQLVDEGHVHQVLVFEEDECVGWCQYGGTAEVATIKNAKAYAKELTQEPDWRIGCVFTDGKHRRAGVSRAAVSAALAAIRDAGGGVVEAYPEQVEDRKPQRGAFLHTGAETLYEELGFVRARRIAKWRWVMRLEVAP